MERSSLRSCWKASLVRMGLGPCGSICRFVALALSSFGGDPSAGGETVLAGDPPAIEQVLAQLRGKYKQEDKKYDALVAKVDKAVRKALASAALPGDTVLPGDADPTRHLDRHPFVVLVNELSAAAKAGTGKASPATNAILASYPWSKDLELVEGLQYGSDRPIPPHESGFIRLGNLPDPAPGHPELCVNQYLFGLHEIVGWQSGVKLEKPLAFRARGPKDPRPTLATALPAWEALRLYLHGSLPEVALFAIPQLTHRIHARLAELRRSADGKAAPMDELLALLDAHWNGFSFQSPYSKAPTAFAVPVFALIADRKGFVYRFEPGAHYGTTGDIPFVSVLTVQRYARAMRSEQFEVRALITKGPAANAATEAFWRDCVYLSRYRAIIDLCVRALLTPEHALPAYLESFDCPGGSAPAERAGARALDEVARKNALLLWAKAGKDPVALADFLHENMLDLEINRFPKNAALDRELAYLAKKREPEILAALQTRMASERANPGAAGDFEREFSPHATYLEPATEAAGGYLLHSYHAFHAPIADAIRAAAYEVVLAELAK